MTSPADVTAVLVTRGDVDLDPIVNSLADFAEVIVYDNSRRQFDVKCYGRFIAASEARTEWVYTQDDDCLVPVAALLQQHNPDEQGILGNKPQGEPWRFLGLGAIFNAALVDETFDRYTDLYGQDDDFYRTADVVFAYQHPYQAVDLGYAELVWSRAPNRMYHQRDHMAVRERALARTLALPARLEPLLTW